MKNNHHIRSVRALVEKCFAVIIGLIFIIGDKLRRLIKPAYEEKIRRAIKCHKAFAIAFTVLCIGLAAVAYGTIGSVERSLGMEDYLPRLTFAFVGAMVCGFISAILFDHYYWYEERQKEKIAKRQEAKMMLREAMAHR